MREIQRFEILGHNLCKNDKQKKKRRREGQCDAQKQYLGGRDYSHT